MLKPIEIKHNIKGRIRVHVLKIKNCEKRALFLKDWLTSQINLKSIEVKSITGSVIIFYDHKKFYPDDITSKIHEWIKNYSDNIELSHIKKNLSGTACDRCIKKEKNTLLGNFVQVILLTGFMAYVFVKEVFFKTTISQRLLSISGFIAIAAASPLIKKTVKDIKEKRFLSLFPFLTIGILTAILLGEAVAALEIIWIMRIGMLLEDYITERSRRQIRDILKGSIKNTFALVNGIEVEIPVSDIKINDTLVLHTGEKIPADGTIIKGSALINESTITGRAEGIKKEINDFVYAGTIIEQGLIFVRAEKIGDETYISRILYLVEESLSNRAPVEKKADILSARLMKIGMLATFLVFLITMDPIKAFSALLVMSCPCATILAASTSITSGIANATKKNILIKGGLYLERFSEANCICFDKTGTLTTDKLYITEIIPKNKKISREEIIYLAATAESHNHHPLARAIQQYAVENNIKTGAHVTCEFIPGKGVEAYLDSDLIVVGNDSIMKDHNISVSGFQSQAKNLTENGNIMVYVAKNDQLIGFIAIANVLKDNLRFTLENIRQSGINEIYMITGDSELLASSMAKTFNFTGYKAKLLPEQKAEFIDELKSRGKNVIMVGDGVNDAFALSKADIGISVGTNGAEAAIEASDISLVDSNLDNIVFVRKLSEKTLKTINENHWLAMTTNLIGVALGAAGILTPFMGGLLHILHTGGIFLNSSLLLNWKPKD